MTASKPTAATAAPRFAYQGTRITGMGPPPRNGDGDGRGCLCTRGLPRIQQLQLALFLVAAEGMVLLLQEVVE